MEPAIYLYPFIYLFLTPNINTISYSGVKCLEKRKYRGWRGKVIVAKAVGIFILYIGKIGFVINRVRGKE